MLLRFIHSCYTRNQSNVNTEDYKHIYKAQELKYVLETRCNNAFVSRYSLSLDETVSCLHDRALFILRVCITLREIAWLFVPVYKFDPTKVFIMTSILSMTDPFLFVRYKDVDSFCRKNGLVLIQKILEFFNIPTFEARSTPRFNDTVNHLIVFGNQIIFFQHFFDINWNLLFELFS